MTRRVSDWVPGPRWMKIRHQVMLRDLGYCRLCQYREDTPVDGEIAHHIVPRRLYPKLDRIIDPYDPRESIWLCLDCHDEVGGGRAALDFEPLFRALVKEAEDAYEWGRWKAKRSGSQ